MTFNDFQSNSGLSFLLTFPKFKIFSSIQFIFLQVPTKINLRIFKYYFFQGLLFSRIIHLYEALDWILYFVFCFHTSLCCPRNIFKFSSKCTVSIPMHLFKKKIKSHPANSLFFIFGPPINFNSIGFFETFLIAVSVGTLYILARKNTDPQILHKFVKCNLL